VYTVNKVQPHALVAAERAKLDAFTMKALPRIKE
jgi:hypothetical protein